MLDYELELGLDGEFESDFEDEFEYESEEFLGAILPAVAPLAVKAIGSLFRESELEGDFEDEFEYEWEADFESSVTTPDAAMMQKLGKAASKCKSEAEAEAFIGAIASLAAKALPKIAPTLIRGAARLGRQLFRSPRTRRLIRAVPTVLEGTTKNLARQVAQGRPLSQQAILRALARNTSHVLRSPRRTAIAMRRGTPRRMRRSIAFR